MLSILLLLQTAGLGGGAPDTLRTREADDALLGIWGYATDFAPAVGGELTVVRDGGAWRATLSRAEAPVTVEDREVRFALPRGSGRFRGRLREDEGAIEGFWIRPGVTDDPRFPGGPSQPFATPVTLRRAGPGRWRGTVRPLADPFTLYLKVFRTPEGVLMGAFRNPEGNSTGGAMQFHISRSGDSVAFRARADPAEPGPRLAAALAGRDTLRVSWPDLGRTVPLARLSPAQAAGFFPRPPGEPAYVYRRPAETGDGWGTASAGEVGIDEAALTRLVRRLIAADPAARRPSLIHSLLVARRGRLVLEEYFHGYGRETMHDTRSAGKTFSSVLLGSAMMRGVPISPETPVYPLLAPMGPFANPDPRKSRITLGHLMTHTSGLACDDNDDDSPGNEGTMQTQRAQPNWWKHTLDLPQAHEPGVRYAYCSANSNLMGAALTTATGTWLPELFERSVARPLQFGEYHWNLMPTGEGYFGGGAWLRPRDLLKVGQAYLDGGVWQGRRIVDSTWVTQSTLARVHISPATTGISPEEFGEYYGEGDDAYTWHLGGVTSAAGNHPGYAATGNGGQVLIVIPELELTVVFTGGNYRQGGIWGRWGNEIVGGEIIPAIRN
jgi:CubicO group peptidase (beta-lactamase class C family)